MICAFLFEVIIIIFITLQRNIKRFKLRNLKDPHYLSCKSIPKELKDAIELKHQYSHLYREPLTLLTTNYLNDLENSWFQIKFQNKFNFLFT